MIINIMLIQSLKQSSPKNNSPSKQHKEFKNIKDSIKSNIFIHQSFLSKLSKAEEKSLAYRLSPSYQYQCRGFGSLEDVELHKKLKLVSLIKSDRRSYDESSVKLSQCEYKAINRNMQYLLQRKRRKARCSETEIDQSYGDIRTSRQTLNNEMAANILKITRSLQSHQPDYHNYMLRSARKSKKSSSVKLPICESPDFKKQTFKEELISSLIKRARKKAPKTRRLKTQEIRKIQEEDIRLSSEEKPQEQIKCNIKIKPTPKMKWAHFRKEGISNPANLKNMNESVRGWTKYPFKPTVEDDNEQSL